MSHPIQVSTSDPIYPPGFGPYANTSNVAEASYGAPSNTPVISNPLFVSTAPINSVPQPRWCPNPTAILYPKFGVITVTLFKRPLKFQALIPTFINIVPLSKLRGWSRMRNMKK